MIIAILPITILLTSSNGDLYVLSSTTGKGNASLTASGGWRASSGKKSGSQVMLLTPHLVRSRGETITLVLEPTRDRPTYLKSFLSESKRMPARTRSFRSGTVSHYLTIIPPSTGSAIKNHHIVGRSFSDNSEAMLTWHARFATEASIERLVEIEQMMRSLKFLAR